MDNLRKEVLDLHEAGFRALLSTVERLQHLEAEVRELREMLESSNTCRC